MMRISFEIETAHDFEILREFFAQGSFDGTGEERKEEGVSPLSSPSSLPPNTPYPITPFNSPSFQEEKREEGTQISRTRKFLREGLREFGPAGNVLLTDDEYRKLTEKFGESKTRDLIERMDYYLEEDPKRKKKYEKRNHYMTLLNWERKDTKENRWQGQDQRQYSFRDIVEMGA